MFAGCSFSESRLHLEIRGRRGQLILLIKVLLRIRAFPNAVFCIVSKDMLYSCSLKYIRWVFFIVPSALMTMGTVSALFFHILPITIAKSLYFSFFSSSFFTTLGSPGTATSMILHSSIILSIRIRSGLPASIVLSHMEDQVGNVCHNCYLSLRQISQIRPYLTEEATATLVHALIISKLDCYNSLLIGIPGWLK